MVRHESTECLDLGAFCMRGAQPGATGYLVSQGYEPSVSAKPRGLMLKGSYSAGVSAGGSQAPVVKSWRRASSLLSPHLVAVSR